MSRDWAVTVVQCRQMIDLSVSYVRSTSRDLTYGVRKYYRQTSISGVARRHIVITHSLVLLVSI